jgi:hypothetical protein
LPGVGYTVERVCGDVKGLHPFGNLVKGVYKVSDGIVDKTQDQNPVLEAGEILRVPIDRLDSLYHGKRPLEAVRTTRSFRLMRLDVHIRAAGFPDHADILDSSEEQLPGHT